MKVYFKSYFIFYFVYVNLNDSEQVLLMNQLKRIDYMYPGCKTTTELSVNQFEEHYIYLSI